MVSLRNGAIGSRLVLSIGQGVKLAVRFVPKGKFRMGCLDGRGQSDEVARTVNLTQDFWMAETELTQAQWKAIMGTTASELAVINKVQEREKRGFVQGNDYPMCFISPKDASRFISEINRHVSLPDGWRWALPTEAQWERACRAGTESAFSFGEGKMTDNMNCLNWDPWGDAAEHEMRAKAKMCKVARYNANAYGLFDMHGNVFELCKDHYAPYHAKNTTDPQETASGEPQVLRGGCFGLTGESCTSSARSQTLSQSDADDSTGLRIVIVSQ